MYTQQFEYVIILAEEMSFSRAAEKLHITQPSLSQSLKKLETSLGVELFTRTRNSVSLTYEGELFIQTAKKITDLYKDYQAQLDDISHNEKGRLVIGVPNFRGAFILERTLPIFTQQYPNVELQIVESSSKQLEDLTARGKTDVTIMNLPFIEKNISYQVLTHEPLLLAAPPNHPICKKEKIVYPQDFNHLPCLSLEEIAKEPFITLKPEHRLGQSTKKIFDDHGIVPNIKLVVHNLLTAQALVTAGLGFSIFGATAAKYSIQATKPVYFSIRDYSIEWTLVAAYPSNRYLSKITKDFIQLAKETLIL